MNTDKTNNGVAAEEIEDFPLELPKKEIKIGGVRYFLIGLTGALRDSYLNDQAQRMKFNKEGKAIGLTNYEGIQSKLINMCLQTTDGKSVGENTIKQWPATTQEALFKRCQQMNAIEIFKKEGEEAAKND